MALTAAIQQISADIQSLSGKKTCDVPGMFGHACEVGNGEGCRSAADWGMLVTPEAPRYYKNVERSNANEHSFFLVCVDVYEVQEVLEMLA